MNVVLQALADPIRRSILLMLRGAPLTAGRIAGEFSVSRPAVSRHLRVLREAGLVRDTDAGRERLYELEFGPLNKIEALLTELRAEPSAEKSAWERRFMALETEVYRTRARGRAGRTKTEQSRRRKTA